MPKRRCKVTFEIEFQPLHRCIALLRCIVRVVSKPQRRNRGMNEMKRRGGRGSPRLSVYSAASVPKPGGNYTPVPWHQINRKNLNARSVLAMYVPMNGCFC